MADPATFLASVSIWMPNLIEQVLQGLTGDTVQLRAGTALYA